MTVKTTLEKLAAIANLYSDDKDGSFVVWSQPEFPQFAPITLADCREVRTSFLPKPIDLKRALTPAEWTLIDRIAQGDHSFDAAEDGKDMTMLAEMGLAALTDVPGSSGRKQAVLTDLGLRSVAVSMPKSEPDAEPEAPAPRM